MTGTWAVWTSTSATAGLPDAPSTYTGEGLRLQLHPSVRASPPSRRPLPPGPRWAACNLPVRWCPLTPVECPIGSQTVRRCPSAGPRRPSSVDKREQSKASRSSKARKVGRQRGRGTVRPGSVGPGWLGDTPLNLWGPPRPWNGWYRPVLSTRCGQGSPRSDAVRSGPLVPTGVHCWSHSCWTIRRRARLWPCPLPSGRLGRGTGGVGQLHGASGVPRTSSSLLTLSGGHPAPCSRSGLGLWHGSSTDPGAMGPTPLLELDTAWAALDCAAQAAPRSSRSGPCTVPGLTRLRLCCLCMGHRLSTIDGAGPGPRHPSPDRLRHAVGSPASHGKQSLVPAVPAAS